MNIFLIIIIIQVVFVISTYVYVVYIEHVTTTFTAGFTKEDEWIADYLKIKQLILKERSAIKTVVELAHMYNISYEQAIHVRQKAIEDSIDYFKYVKL